MSHATDRIDQIVHRTCTGCGHVMHYDGSLLDRERMDALRSQACEECGESEAVIMMTECDPSMRFALSPLPRQR
jgi:formate dehydrogenase maturation protein FdhE